MTASRDEARVVDSQTSAPERPSNESLARLRALRRSLEERVTVLAAPASESPALSRPTPARPPPAPESSTDADDLRDEASPTADSESKERWIGLPGDIWLKNLGGALASEREPRMSEGVKPSVRGGSGDASVAFPEREPRMSEGVQPSVRGGSGDASVAFPEREPRMSEGVMSSVTAAAAFISLESEPRRLDSMPIGRGSSESPSVFSSKGQGGSEGQLAFDSDLLPLGSSLGTDRPDFADPENLPPTLSSEDHAEGNPAPGYSLLADEIRDSMAANQSECADDNAFFLNLTSPSLDGNSLRGEKSGVIMPAALTNGLDGDLNLSAGRLSKCDEFPSTGCACLCGDLIVIRV